MNPAFKDIPNFFNWIKVEEVKNMLERAEQVLEWYDEFRTYIPNWYKPDSSTLS